VVVLSNALWHRRFSADPNIIGRKILLDGKPHAVVGVTPAGMPFYGVQLEASLPERADVYVPLRLPSSELDLTEVGSQFWSAAVGRLKRNVSLEQAHAEVEVSLARLSRDNKEHVEIHAQMQPLQTRRRHTKRAARPVGCSGFGTADCLRQHCQPDIGSSYEKPARTLHSGRSRGRQASPDRTIVRGEFADRDGRDHPWAAAGPVDYGSGY
jgi:hypothetical protein